MGIMKKKFCGGTNNSLDLSKFAKVEELSLLLVRMGIQNGDFLGYSEP